MNKTIRVRFAPSPTGHLHIGGARTALFNYLYARQLGGTFVLRLEDTDVERSTEESVHMILADLKWLGLNWDEGPEAGGDFGPYRQSERIHLYREKAAQLVETGKAYYCFCTAEEVEEQRKAAMANGLQPKYDGTCRSLPGDEAKRRAAENEPHVIRFKTPQSGETVIDDLIRKKVVFENSTLDDFVIVRTNGLPTYNFAAVIDDTAMKISHIIRGDDHLSNTPRQICLYQALGEPLPEFAHVPMILGSDKTRLSKRHGATSVGAYQQEGYLPEALINYLALLGWSFDDKTTLFSREELIEKFSLEKVSKNPAVFDPQKLLWMNGQYIRSVSADRYFEAAKETFYNAKLGTQAPEEDWATARASAEVVREKIKLLTELPAQVEYFYHEPNLDNLDEKTAKQLMSMAEQKELFISLLKELEQMPSFGVEEMEKIMERFIAEKGVKFGVLAHPLRVCLTGRMSSPGIFEVMQILGKARVIERFKAGMKKAGVI